MTIVGATHQNLQRRVAAGVKDPGTTRTGESSGPDDQPGSSSSAVWVPWMAAPHFASGVPGGWSRLLVIIVNTRFVGGSDEPIRRFGPFENDVRPGAAYENRRNGGSGRDSFVRVRRCLSARPLR